jgi:ribosome-dependent ATPase
VRLGALRLLAYTIREALELARDRIRLGFALLGTALLMLVFGFGITMDVDHLSFAALDRDATPESRAYLRELRGSRYFDERTSVADYAELERRMQSGELMVVVEIPPEFGRRVRQGRPAEVGAWVDGAMPFRAETARGYLEGVHRQYLADLAAQTSRPAPALSATIETRFRYNQDFQSVYAMVPSTIVLLLALIPAILMALAVVREKELGSIVNLYVTPVTRLEFVVGKQLPYVAVAMVNFLFLAGMAVFVFGVPLKGSFAALALGALVYVTATTGYGLVISSFANTQLAALFGTAILTFLPAMQFSGMLSPISSLSGAPAVMAHGFPMTYFLPVSVGTFTKSLGLGQLGGSIFALSLFIPVLTVLSILLLRKQER